jgi:plastocyanin
MLRNAAKCFVFAITVLAIAPITALRADTPPAAKDVTVTILNFKFDAETVEVPVGTKVTWVNKDTTVHTVVSKDKTFTSSPGLDTGDNYSYVFTKAGTYNYYCSLHPFMTGKVVVVDKASGQSGY